MSGNFKVGDVCIGQNYIFDTHLNGTECTIVGALEMRNSRSMFSYHTSMMYRVEWANGSDLVNVFPTHLRRKQPPAGEASILNMFVVAPPKRMKEPA